MSRRRKVSAASFPPVAVAAFRKDLVSYYERTLADLRRARTEGVLSDLMVGLPEDSAENAENEIIGAKNAELFWVSDEIARQAMDASQDVPHISPLDAPASSGILFFEKPLPPLPMDVATRKVYLSQLQLTAEKVGLDALTNLTSEAYGVMWSHIGRGMLALSVFGLHGARSKVPGDIDPRIPLGYFDLPLGRITEIGELTQSEGQQAFLAFLSALWVLMKTPTVALVSEGDIATGDTVPRPEPIAQSDGLLAPFAVPEKRRVQVVDMVPMRHSAERNEADDDSQGGKRAYRKSGYKWVVRGHWRNQAVGKDRKGRQLTWIASYLKGNPDGPLKTSEKVYSWRSPKATLAKKKSKGSVSSSS